MLNLKFFHSVLLLSSIGLYQSCCPEGWVKGRYSCYYPSHDSATWLAASIKCQSMASNLTVINNQDENNFVAGMIKEYIHAYKHNFWLDGTDVNQEGHFIWHSAKHPISYKNWNVNEPSGGSEDCIEMLVKEFVDPRQIGKWNDKICSYLNHYICEKSIDDEGPVLSQGSVIG
ncbi:perlucin-like [Ostrea edulis]|uniref:perlucin-like n=1 Tax=Ostrea edulis TaxID=37623 RepID=UPI0024AEDCDF|nr:perlucin-like [Ostrea edulis]